MATASFTPERRYRVRRCGGATLLLSCLFVWSCDAEPDEVPEVADIERDIVGFPGGSGVALREEVVLGPGDIGETFMVNGWVTGKPIAGRGFLVRTEGERRIFVESTERPPADSAVRVIGRLAVVDEGVIKEWVEEALQGTVVADWDFEPIYYLQNARVERIEAATPDDRVRR